MLPLSDNELDQMLARERDRGALPLTDWDSLSTRLRAEGLIKDPFVSRLAVQRWMQVAAALTIAVGGAAVGRFTAGAPVVPVPSAQTAPAETVPASSATSIVAAEQPSNAALASGSAVAQFKSPEEAWDVLNRAGDEYQRASAYLSATNTSVPMPPEPEQYRTRLAALDNVMAEMRDALKEAPQDPVINQYYLATVGAREATLSQLKSTLPKRASLNRF